MAFPSERRRYICRIGTIIYGGNNHFHIDYGPCGFLKHGMGFLKKAAGLRNLIL